MDNTWLERIETYCNNQKDTVSQFERDYMWRRFTESYFSEIKKKEQAGSVITDLESNAIKETLLSDNSLETSLSFAKKQYEQFEDSIYSSAKKQMNKGSFWKSVFQSILANFFYSALLIIIFYVAKDQIITWLSSLTN